MSSQPQNSVAAIILQSSKLASARRSTAEPCRISNFSLFMSRWIENRWGTWVELLSLSVIAFQTNRQSQLQWRPLFLNALHESPDILTDQWRFVIGQRRKVHFEADLGIIKRDAFESTMHGAFRACWRQPGQDAIVG
jgi:hypothetical protein